MSNVRIFLLTSVLLSGGCVNWSKDVDAYRQVLDTRAPATRPVFEAGDPLTLVDALRLANADNEMIASSGEDYIQALAEKMRQAGTFLPTLSLTPSYSLSHTDGKTSDSNSITAGAGVSGSLSDLSNIEAAGLTVEQRRQLLLDVRETVLLQVAQAYYEVLRREKQVEVLRGSVAVRQEQVRDQEARLKLGNARPLDLAQSQSDLAATRVSLAQAETDTANGRSALARLMGVSAVDGPLVDRFDVPGEVPSESQWLEQALAHRNDLAAAGQATEAARVGVESAIRQYFPSVSINFNYFLHTDPSGAQKWTGGISANVPIFSGLQIEADIRRAWSRYRQAGFAESQTRRAVIDDVTQAVRNLANSRAKIAHLQVQVEAAQRAFDLAERAYRLGSDSNLNRLTQQDNLLTAQLSLIDEQFSEKVSYLSLLRAVGGLADVLR